MHEASFSGWQVRCDIGFAVTEPATFVLAIAPAADTGDRRLEELNVTVDGRDLEVERIEADHGALLDIVRSPPGEFEVAYRAEIAVATESTPAPPADLDRIVYARPSRYCASDRTDGFVVSDFGAPPHSWGTVRAVRDWVAQRLDYEIGAGGPTATATDALEAGAGVCRDFAHLAITVLRALDIPARLVAVYAPGLEPMDFHAVVEAHIDGEWVVVDATGMAPRQSLVRIATGRDAADTAFVTAIGGEPQLVRCEVGAIVDGELPHDRHDEPVRLLSAGVRPT